MSELAYPISLKTAAQHGIKRLRQSQWADERSYLKITIDDNAMGVWAYLYDQMNVELNGTNPYPLLLLHTDTGTAEWFEYTGELSEDDNDDCNE